MRSLFILIAALASGTIFAQQNKKADDRDAIHAMAGCYKVSFDFAETFSPDTAYKYHDRYSSWGIEYVLVIEDSENFISLQHLLIINDSTIIKHWRQDWEYEATELLAYDRDKTWKTKKFSADEVKGTWTQRVFQVDDSPRYESKGTWVHVDGQHYWEGIGDAPLPRREFSVRSDYNVTKRKSRIQLDGDGWYLEQDNQKILRTDTGDKLICNEKGMETFTTGAYNCQPAIDWWEENKGYWEDVRTVWGEVFKENPELGLTKKVNDKMLWQALFGMGDEMKNEVPSKKQRKEIKAVIEQYIKA